MGVAGQAATTLGLRAGQLVEVKSEADILATLAADGTLDGLPFMPEMLAHCGKRVRVFRRADKTCDTVRSWQSRRVFDTVHLEGLRCGGEHHDGCQYGCLLFWKEAWLRPLDDVTRDEPPRADESATQAAITRDALMLTTKRNAPAPEDGELYVCQATELPKFTTPLDWWDPRQYVREYRSGNVGAARIFRVLLVAAYNVVARRLQRVGVKTYPYIAGSLKKTPIGALNLVPGERVRVKPKAEILATLNSDSRNRGLKFDVELVPYCEREFRVLRRVDKLINDRNGKMLLVKDCILLEGTCCGGEFSRNRLLCPRSLLPFWRETWLERIEEPRTNDEKSPSRPS
jgi:hypothetical protein